MQAFVDNDLLHKLALFQLLELFEARLKGGGCRLYALGTFRFRYELHDPVRGLKRCYTDTALAALRKFVEENGEVPVIGGSPLYAELVNIPGVDTGELQLLVAAIHDDNAIVYTSDKRFLRALAADIHLADQRRALEGRVVVLEQIILGLMKQETFEDVKRRVLPALKHDTMMRSIFGSGEEATLESVSEAVIAYVEESRRELGALLSVGWPPAKCQRTRTA